MDGMGSREELERMEEWESIISICCMTKESMFNKKKIDVAMMGGGNNSLNVSIRFSHGRNYSSNLCIHWT